MSNPKVRSLGRRGGQRGSQGETEGKSSYGFHADDETKNIVKSLFEEYASDDGKNFYTGSRDERSEREHEDFLEDINKKLSDDGGSEYGSYSDEDEAAEEIAAETVGDENADNADKTPEADGSVDSEDAVESIPTKRIRKVSPEKTKKKETEEEASDEAAKKPSEETAKAPTRKRKAASTGMKKRSKPKKKEYYEDEYEDSYEDTYEDEYEDDIYEDEYDDDYDDYDDDDYEKSGGGVEFSLKVVALTILLVIVLLVMTALFINNRSLSRELAEEKTKYDDMLNEYNQKVEQLNVKISELTEPETVAAGAAVSDPNVSEPTSEAQSAAGSDGQTKYVVQPGDTLYKIAANELGDQTKYDLIQKANNMGSSTNLSVGQELIIPAA